jgi:hypothetical protein
VKTFGYPTSRTFTFLDCPVQFFQRQVIQNCPGQGAALINILDPGIFPFTLVNVSTFPAPDPTMKANTPAVGDPNYSTLIVAFINQNVPNMFAELPVASSTTSTIRAVWRSGARRFHSQRRIPAIATSSISASSAGSCTTSRAPGPRAFCSRITSSR